MGKLSPLRKGKTTFFSLCLTKNSPLTPYFKKVATQSIQSGLREALMSEWIGPKIEKNPGVESYQLTLGKTFLLFSVLFVSVLASFIILLAEFIVIRLLNLKIFPSTSRRNTLFISE